MHPVFSWTMPPDETADTLYIANRQETTPLGAFYEENVGCPRVRVRLRRRRVGTDATAVRRGSVVDRQDHNHQRVRRCLLATIALHGHRQRPHPLAPREPQLVHLHPVEPRRNGRLVLEREQHDRHSRRLSGEAMVGRVRRVETRTVEWPVNETTYLTWRKPRGIRRGVRLRLVVSVRGAGAVSSTSRFVRAP
jgi:hypothetical protein